MDGSHSRKVSNKETSVRFLYERGVSTFVPALPINSVMTDVLLYRPYQPGESLKVDFYNDQSDLVLSLPNVMTNIWREVNVVALGIVPIQVFGDVAAIVFCYK